MFRFHSAFIDSLGVLKAEWSWALHVLGLLALSPLSFAHGTHSELLSWVDKKLVEQPANGELWCQRAWLNLEHEDWKQTLSDVEKAEKLAPGQYPTGWFKGEALVLAGKLPEAKKVLDDFIVQFPQDKRGNLSRARVLVKLGMKEEALADYRRALAMSPETGPDLVQEAAESLAENGHLEEGIQVIDSGLNRLGGIPSLLMKVLEMEMKAGRHEAALSRVDAMQESAPRPEPWMAKRAQLLAQAGRLDESRAAWKALIIHLERLPNLERGSNSMSLLAEQARGALESMERPDRRTIPIKPGAIHEEEIELVSQHLNRAADDASIWLQRALLLLADGEFQQALLDCDEVDRLAPGKFPTGYVRSQVLLDSGELEKGRVALDEFLNTHPDHLRGLVARARLQLKSHQNESALADYRSAMMISGDKPEIDLVLETASAFAANGRRGEAIEMLRSQLSSRGNIPELFNRLLELEIADGKFDEAISRVGELAKHSSQPAPWLAKRAELLSRAGHAAEAHEAWLSLQTHLDSLPNLQRGQPAMAALAQQVKSALSESSLSLPAQ